MAWTDVFEKGWWPAPSPAPEMALGGEGGGGAVTTTKTQLLVRAALLLLAAQVAVTLYNGVRIRWMFWRMRSQGIALPQPYSLFLGHIPFFLAIRHTHLRNAGALSSFFLRILILHWQDYFPCPQPSAVNNNDDGQQPPEVIYLDLWPLVSQPVAVVADAALCQAIVSERYPVRHEQVKQLSRAIAGPRTLFEWDGPAHRVWRTRLNPGFSMKNLMGHVAVGRVVDEVVVFAEGIKKLAGSGTWEEGDEGDGGWGEVFQMFPRTVALTFDIICGVALDFSPGEQINGPTEMQQAFDTLRERHLSFKHLINLPKRLNPFWHLEYYRCHATLRRVLLPHIQRQLPQNNNKQTSEPPPSTTLSSPSPSTDATTTTTTTTTTTRPKTVVDHALKEIRQEQQQQQQQQESQKGQPPAAAAAVTPSQDFIEDVLGLTKQFIFAGHDTTAITLSFAFHYLARNRGAVRRLRAEHDEVFGGAAEDVRGTPRRLREAPHLINALPFTAAVVKETLRLCPVAATVRDPGPEYQLTHPETGRVFPTHGFILVSGTSCLHYDPRVWARPTEFLPERWVAADEADPLCPPAGHKYAWRPFEYGPMGCIGQELALIELKMALLFTVRELEFETAIEEWDRARGIKTEERPTVFGDPIYQVGIGLGPPTEKLPMRVRRLKR